MSVEVAETDGGIEIAREVLETVLVAVLEAAIEAEEILKTRDQLYRMLSKQTGQSIKQIQKDADRDKYFTAQEAKEYGLIDKVISKR